jgi:ABC-2 type transport system ATP-binding protein
MFDCLLSSRKPRSLASMCGGSTTGGTDMDKSPAVWARGITQSFGDVVALDGVDVEGASGQVHGLAGLNDAGTTTLLGPAVADSGQLEIPGTPVRRTLAVPLGVAGFVDGPELHTALTARQNLSALTFLRRPSTSSTSPQTGGTSPTETDRRR